MHTQGLKVPVCVVFLSRLVGCSWGFGGGAPQQAGEKCCRHKASNARQVTFVSLSQLNCQYHVNIILNILAPTESSLASI